MNIICADDERLALNLLTSTVKEILPEAQIHAFKTGREVLGFAETTVCQIAFLDINMGQSNGIELAYKLKIINPKINIIFVTGYDEFYREAFDLHASGYVLKPVTKEALLKEINALRIPLDDGGAKTQNDAEIKKESPVLEKPYGYDEEFALIKKSAESKSENLQTENENSEKKSKGISGFFSNPWKESDQPYSEYEKMERLVSGEEEESNSEKLVVKTFGNFELFYKGEIVKFKRSKSKELIAYLIDRKGASVQTQELVAALWEDQVVDHNTRSQLQNLTADIRSTFDRLGIKNVFLKGFNSYAIKVENVDCDYYKFLAGDVPAINSFMGEYMNNYSWGEFTLGALTTRSR